MSRSKRIMKGVRCPVKGCRSERLPDQVMCRGHWYTVPSALRTRVWNLWRTRAGLAARREAARTAIRFANMVEADRAAWLASRRRDGA